VYKWYVYTCCTEELPDYLIVASVLGFLLVVVMVVALLAYRCVQFAYHIVARTTHRCKKTLKLKLYLCFVISCSVSVVPVSPNGLGISHAFTMFQTVTEAKLASRPKFWPRPRSRSQSFGLGLGLGLKHLASAWPRSSAEEPAVKKRLTSLFADYRTSHNDTCRR